MLASLLLLLHHVELTNSFAFDDLQPRCHDAERVALWKFKESFSIYTSDYCYPKVESWKLHGENSDCCSWDGVQCDEETGNVIRLDLSSSCLYGFINSSSSLFSLVHLQELNLADNDFNFSLIPPQIGNLSKLTYLNLSYSSFSGQVPSEVSKLSVLESLDLSWYEYFETPGFLIIHEPNLENLICNMTSLRELHLSEVNISSKVPELLANFSSLKSLILHDCGLRGAFPIGIFQLPNMNVIDVSQNEDLTGSLPVFHQKSPLKSLIVYRTNFGGELPPSIGNLSYLKAIQIGSCNFSGRIPSFLGNLTDLVDVDLSESRFTAQTLSSFSWIGKLSKLTSLRLTDANLNGEIPSWLMNLTQLSLLKMGHNELIGPIPSFLMNLTRLQYLYLNSNQFSGPLPSEINNLSQLICLDLSLNHLKGPIPTIFELQNLDYLDLHSNYLVGTVDINMFFQLKNLEGLILSFNNFQLLTKITTNASVPNFTALGLALCNLTDFPSFLQNQDQLRFLDLSSNNLNGQIPSWICNLSVNLLGTLDLSHNSLTGFENHQSVLPWANLRVLDLRYNMMKGSLPIPPLSIFVYLVSHNKLEGRVSPLLCNASALKILDLSFNYLGGTLPQCLGNSLSVLALSNNKFNGSIPPSWRTGCQLKMLDLSHNHLQGQLPRSLVDCTNLEFLHFGNNRINDGFPSWLGSLPKLSVLILRFNSFRGVIERHNSFPNLRILDLSHNSFTGKLPSMYFEIWDVMKMVNESHMSYMNISLRPRSWFAFSYYGDYDYSITTYTKGLTLDYQRIPDTLVFIDFSNNKFEGEIPLVLGYLRGLRQLNLSSNALTGPIPLTLGHMSVLESLDLSNNSLSGEIPQQLAQLTFLSVLNVSYNNLSGSIPQGTQFSTFNGSSFEGNNGLCGKPLSKRCGNYTGASQPPASTSEEDESSGSPFQFGWKIVVIGYACGLAFGAVVGHIVTFKKREWFLRTFRIRQQNKKRRIEIRGYNN